MVARSFCLAGTLSALLFSVSSICAVHGVQVKPDLDASYTKAKLGFARDAAHLTATSSSKAPETDFAELLVRRLLANWGFYSETTSYSVYVEDVEKNGKGYCEAFASYAPSGTTVDMTLCESALKEAATKIAPRLRKYTWNARIHPWEGPASVCDKEQTVSGDFSLQMGLAWVECVVAGSGLTAGLGEAGNGIEGKDAWYSPVHLSNWFFLPQTGDEDESSSRMRVLEFFRSVMEGYAARVVEASSVVKGAVVAPGLSRNALETRLAARMWAELGRRRFDKSWVPKGSTILKPRHTRYLPLDLATAETVAKKIGFAGQNDLDELARIWDGGLDKVGNPELTEPSLEKPGPQPFCPEDDGEDGTEAGLKILLWVVVISVLICIATVVAIFCCCRKQRDENLAGHRQAEVGAYPQYFPQHHRAATDHEVIKSQY